MRLIDADKLIILAENTFARPNGFIQLIKETETAYDVDAVVAEIRRSSGNGYRDIDGDYVPPMIETKDAIDIVRKGGVE